MRNLSALNKLVGLISMVLTSYSYHNHKSLSNSIITIKHITVPTSFILHAIKETNKDSAIIGEQYSNPITSLLGQFIPKTSRTISNQKQTNNKNNNNTIQYKSVDEMKINWDMKKRTRTNIPSLIKSLEKELIEKEWFVTGNVNPSYFSNDFQFQDPDVKIKGIQQYARGVNKIFVQNGETRAEIITIQEDRSSSNSNNNSNNSIKSSTTAKSTTASSGSSATSGSSNKNSSSKSTFKSISPTTTTAITPNCHRITIVWRLSGRVNIGPAGLPIKPYIIFTDYDINTTTGLIEFQQDRFSIPGYDILLSALFPVLTTWGILANPCPSVDELKKNKVYG